MIIITICHSNVLLLSLFFRYIHTLICGGQKVSFFESVWGGCVDGIRCLHLVGLLLIWLLAAAAATDNDVQIDNADRYIY